MLQRQPTLPSAAQWMGQAGAIARPAQTPEQMRIMLQIIADATGCRMRTKES